MRQVLSLEVKKDGTATVAF